MTPESIVRIQELLEVLETQKDHLVIDAGAHISDLEQLSGWDRERFHANHNYYHGRPIDAQGLLAEMQLAEVDMALVWPNPSVLHCTDDLQHNLAVLLAGNHYVYESVRQHPARFIPGGWVDPRHCQLDHALQLVEQLVNNFGFVFIKVTPGREATALDSKPVQEIIRRIVSLGAIPCFHVGAEAPFVPAPALERLTALYPNHPLLAIHMGGSGAGVERADEIYHQARELGLWRPTIRYALSAKREPYLESDFISYQLAGEPFSRNLFCASDVPFGRMTWKFGGFRAMLRSFLHGKLHYDARLRANPTLFNADDVQNYLGRNLAEFVISGYHNLLEHHGAV